MEKQSVEHKSSIVNKLKSIKHIEIIVILVICAIAVLLFMNSGVRNVESVDSFQSYVLKQEKSVMEVIKRIEGVGNVSVMISYQSASEQVYAYEEEEKTVNGVTTVTKELVYVSGKPVVLTELAPKVQGVVVVAEGADNGIIKLNILKAVMALLDIQASKIEIFTYGQG